MKDKIRTILKEWLQDKDAIIFTDDIAIEEVVDEIWSILNEASESDFNNIIQPHAITEDHETPYCGDCGSTTLTYLTHYPNGNFYKCKTCGEEFLYKFKEQSQKTA